MYCPEHFAQHELEPMRRLIRARPLATLVARTASGLEANHLPLLLVDEPQPRGALQGHVAKANPLWSQCDPQAQVLAVFQGPQSYVSPGWYATKARDGRVVPTWNYVAVHAYGRMRVVRDRDWIRALLERLTDTQEATMALPWRVADAPADYLEQMLGAVVGIEIELTRLCGKWKVSQNQPQANRHSLAGELRRRGDPFALAMAALVEDPRDPG